MEPLSKRLRLGPSPYPDDDEEDQDELSMTPAQFDTTQDPMYQLDKSRAKAATRLKSTFEDIFAKYGKDFAGDDDVINLYTDEIEIDNGHVQSLKNQKDGATENSLSTEEEEEERIVNGKSGSRKKKSRSQSLTPANHVGYNQRLQFNSPWNEHPGLGAHRSSSPAFSSFPYLPHPSFDFGHSTFGNSHVDPVWQTPDLPIQPPHYQYGSLIGIGGSQFGSFSESSNHSAKRLASAKSFLLRASSTSSGADEVEAEEDDILLGRNNQEIVPYPHREDRESAPMLATPISSHRSSQSPDSQPQFYGVGLAEDELCTERKSTREEVVQTNPTEPLVTEVASASLQSVNGNSQHSQTARSSHSQSPSRHKRGRPKKPDALELNNLADEGSNDEIRPLKQNERRIEIIISTMKRPLSTEIEQASAGIAPVTNEIPQLPETEPTVSISENAEVTFPEDELHTSQSTSSHETVVQRTSMDLSKDSEVAQAAKLPKSSKHATSSPEIGKLWRRWPKRRQEHTGPLSANTPPHEEETQENARAGVSRGSGSSETATDSSADDNLSGRLNQVEQLLDGDNEIAKVAPSQPPSPIAEVAMSEEQAIPDTSVEGNVEAIQVDQHNIKEISVLPVIPTGILCDGDREGATQMPGSSTTEVVPNTSESPKLQILSSENDYPPRNQPDHSPIISSGEELLPTRPLTPDDTTTLVTEVCSSEVADVRGARISTPEQDVRSRSPEPLAIRETTESDIYPDRGRLSPTFEASDICEEQEHDTPSGSVCDSVLVTEINGLQLWSDGQHVQRSPSLGAMELPDQDLSAFPTIPDPAHSTSKMVLRPLSRPTEDGQCTSGIGRSPSPELGTPIGSNIVREAASRTKGPRAPATPTRKQGPKSAKPRSSDRRTSPSKRFPLTSLTPGDIDDDSDDELSMAFSFSGRSSRFHSPFSRASDNNNPELPPLLCTPRQKTRTSNQAFGVGRSKNTPPATESRVGRSQTRQGRSRPVHSSPLARRVAERLLSSPTKRHRATPTRSPSLVASPYGTLRRCGEEGFVCGRDFCFTCCI